MVDDLFKIGKQLGAGQFGIVVQAQQIGNVKDPEDITAKTVAVKMVKSSLNTTSLESLASELKILIHLGPHLNVVNLLGACTKDITNGLSYYILLDLYNVEYCYPKFLLLLSPGELLVIEEFCRYGNIRDYLIANRDSFINELDEQNIGESQASENSLHPHQKHKLKK